MSHLKSIGIDVGVIAKGLNHRVSLFSARIDSLDAEDISYDPVSIANYSQCGCDDMTAADALNALAQLRAETGDRVDAIEAQLAGGGGGGGLTNWSEDGNGHILPNTDNLQDVGSAANRVRDLYLGPDSLKIVDNSGNVEAYGKAWFDAQPTSSQVTSLGTRIGALEQAPTVYQKNNLPLVMSNGQVIFVEDGSISGTPTLAYGYNGKWFRGTDNSELSDQTVDIFLIAGQSNAHGWADVVNGLSNAQATQEGIFYTSWHDHTSNASDTQYYSDWATSLVAGDTRGDSGKSTLGGSDYFGPELGFVDRGDVINLTSGKPIGILKYAVGTSALTDDPSDPTGGTSDWDITATGNRRGDALRGFKLAVDDAVTKLDNAGYSYRIAGMIWWQQLAPTVAGTTTLMNHIRSWLDTQGYLDMQASQFPIVITKNGHGTDLTPVASADAYIGVVDAGAFGHSAGQNHVGQASHGSSDTDSSGTNDMFEIGEAYADQMQLAIAGNTNSAWNPTSITTRLWVDMDDQTTFTSSGGHVTAIADKSGNNYSFAAKSGATITAVSNAQNGKNVLRFDGNSDATTSTSVAFNTSARHKWFFTVKVTASQRQDVLLIVQKGTTFRMIMQNLDSDGVFPADWNVVTGTKMQGNPTNLLGQWVLLSAEFDVPNGVSSAWLNGTAYNTNVAQANLTAANFTNMTVKLCENSGTQVQDADWGELVMTEDVSQANSDKIEGYLAHKWGIASSLPSSHPYQTSAP